MKLLTRLCCIALVLSGTAAFGQNPEVMPDVHAQAWTSVQLRYKASEKWRFSIEEQARTSATPLRLERHFTELGAQYSLVKILYFRAGYRYQFIRNEVGPNIVPERHNRFHFSIANQLRMGRLQVQTRWQVQQRREQLRNTHRQLRERRRYQRVRLRLDYNIPGWKYDPRIAGELFLRTQNGPRGQHNKYRLTIGTQFKVAKRQRMAVRYLFEREFTPWNPEVLHAISLQYTYSRKPAKQPQPSLLDE